MPEGTGRAFIVQWHVTDRCKQRCKHCYIYGSNASRGQAELTFEQCLQVLRDVSSTVIEEFGVKLRINYSGGDPLLRDDFFELLHETKKVGIEIGILGNPHLIDDAMADKLHSINLSAYQMSIDGNRETHDSIRGQGSYERTVSAARMLMAHNVPVHIMATIGKYNVNDLSDIAHHCADIGVKLFSFDLFIPNSSTDIAQLLEPEELRSVMYGYRELAQRLSRSSSTIFREKNNLWTLLDQDLGIESSLVIRSRTCGKICAGCSIGINGISILADGTVYPCRRLPLEIGKFPEQTMKEVFFGEKMESLRQEEKIDKCNRCDLFYVCRGCRAMAYSVNRDYFSPDPSCWRNSNPE